ncbi:MAG TPA: ATP-binding protein [Kofleriaceae bacterium]
MGDEDSAWFDGCAAGAVRDFLDVCADPAVELPGEQALRELGARCAREGQSASAWYPVADALYRALVPRLVHAFAGEPERLHHALLALGAYVQRAAAVTAGAYDTVQAQLRAASAARLEALASVAHELAAASGHIDGLLALVARRLVELLGDGCAVRLISDDGDWLEPSRSFWHADPALRDLAHPVLGLERQRLGAGLAGQVAQTGVARLLPVVDPAQFLAAVPPQFRPLMIQLGVSSAMAIPLRSREKTIGAISLLRHGASPPYTADDLRLAQELADRAGLAVDNAVLVATLEQRVAERTAALETANQELEAFSYSASHDLRTPLRAIDGFSRMLLADHGDKLDAQARHYLARIRAGTQKMGSLIDDLLDLARISRVPLVLEPLDLTAIAHGVVAELRKHDPARTTQIDVAPGLTARADARMIELALENLLGNAWKFTARRADAQIWFGADGPSFFVRDTGAGFDMAYAEKLFVPFQRLHTPQEFDGIGVGLATVQRIIHHHGGRIWARGEVGRGATFSFTLGDHA